jgi:hypothetical protein
LSRFRKTLGQIFGVDADDDDNETDDDEGDEAAVVPTTVSAFKSKIAEVRGERENAKQELTRRRLESVRPGEADLARSTEKDLWDRMGRCEVIAGELEADLHRLLQAQQMDRMHTASDDALAQNSLKKLRQMRTDVIEKRLDADDNTRRFLGREIHRLEFFLDQSPRFRGEIRR